MDILTYINRMNQLYGNEPAPVRYNTQKYLQGGRVQYKPGGLVEPGVTHYAKKLTMKEKHKAAYDSGYKFYKDKGIKITDKIKELVRKNISVNEGKFIPPKFSTQLIEGFTTWMPDYTLKMLKTDLRAGKNSHEIAIEYFKKNKANVLKSLEGTKYYTKPLSALSTRIGNVIRKDKELLKLHNKIKKENSFIKSRSKAKYINDVETLLPIAQEQGIVPKVDWRGKPIKTASQYFVHAKKVKADPISKLFGYYEKVGIEHPGGIARAIILEDPKTLNDIVATMPETNMLKGATLDKYATGQAKFYKDIGDSKYIKNLNKISKKGWEEYRKPRAIYKVVDEKVVRKPTKFSLAKPDLIADAKSFINEYIAAGGSSRDNFSKLDSNLQKAIKAYEAKNSIKGNQFLKASIKSTGAGELLNKTIKQSIASQIRTMDGETISAYKSVYPECFNMQGGKNPIFCLTKQAEKNQEKFVKNSVNIAKATEGTKTSSQMINFLKNFRKVGKVGGWLAVGEAAFAPLIGLPMWAQGTPKDEIAHALTYGLFGTKPEDKLLGRMSDAGRAVYKAQNLEGEIMRAQKALENAPDTGYQKLQAQKRLAELRKEYEATISMLQNPDTGEFNQNLVDKGFEEINEATTYFQNIKEQNVRDRAAWMTPKVTSVMEKVVDKPASAFTNLVLGPNWKKKLPQHPSSTKYPHSPATLGQHLSYDANQPMFKSGGRVYYDTYLPDPDNDDK